MSTNNTILPPATARWINGEDNYSRGTPTVVFYRYLKNLDNFIQLNIPPPMTPNEVQALILTSRSH